MLNVISNINQTIEKSILNLYIVMNMKLEFCLWGMVAIFFKTILQINKLVINDKCKYIILT